MTKTPPNPRRNRKLRFRDIAVLGLLALPLAGLGCIADPSESNDERLGTADSALTAAQCGYFDASGKDQICHHTGSQNKPYTIIKTSVQGCIHGHSGHDGDYITSTDPSSPTYDPTCNGGGCLPANAPCDATLPCCGNSSCTNSFCGCDAGWGGARCETQCPPGLTGIDCDSPSLPCEPTPCQNGGVCTPGAAPSTTYTCSCPHGYTGVDCEIDAFAVKHCDSNPCVGEGSTCVDGPEGYTCLCAAPCPAAANECEVGGCDSTIGRCVIPAALPDGAACTDDDNPCTVDACQSGTCAHVVGPDVCNGMICNGTPLLCDEQSGDCATGSCSVAQDAVPGAFVAQTITLGDAVLQVPADTAIQVGGIAATDPVALTIQSVSDSSLIPSGLPTADPVISPIYQFGPSGTHFAPGLLFTIPVPLTATTPSAWLCDDAGLNCERRNGFLTLDDSVSPPQQTLTVAIDHFSTLVVTQSPNTLPQEVCVTVQQGFSGNVKDTTAQGGIPYGPSTNLRSGREDLPPGGGNENPGGQQVWVPLLQWDLSSLPTNANVTSAFLYVFVENTLSRYVATTVYPLGGPWDEATVTFGTRPKSYVPGVPLEYGKSTAGADITYMTQLWTIGDLPNHGVELYADVANGTANSAGNATGSASFWSSEAPTVSVRPRLDVCYTVPCPGPGCVVPSGPGLVTQVSAGNEFTCVVKEDATLACWGDNSFGQLAVPGGTFTQLSSGGWHSCAIGTSGQVSCWGDNSFGQASPPTGTFTQISAGELYTCGVRTNGNLACWGLKNDGVAYDYGQANPPAGAFLQVSVGFYQACGLNANHIPVCWGGGATTFPQQTYAQVLTSSSQTTCTLLAGKVGCTGNNTADGATPPNIDFVAQFSLGYHYGCALRTTGTLACWGDNSYGQATPPPYGFVQSATGRQHACGITSDGVVACWGRGSSGETAVPAAFASLAPTCTDGVKNGSETGNDCGGACPTCANGGGCGTNADCASGNCVSGVCKASLESCAAIKAANPAATNGMYVVSPPGAAPFQAYCDMTNGGWTLIQSHNAGVLTSSSATSVGLASAKYLQANLAQALANVSTSVRISRRNTATYVQSVDGDPITRLRTLAILNDPAHQDGTHWTGTGTGNLSYSCVPVPNAYPDIYSACGNTTGMHIQAANQAPANHTFNYNAGLQDIDVWVGNASLESCAAIKAANPAATNGMYTISPAGTAPFQAYCDMTNGGWTLIQSHNAGVLTSSSATSVGLASAKYLQADLAQALANVSTSVRISRRNTATYVQSVDGDPITRLRTLAILNDPAHKDGTHWSGTGTGNLSYSCVPLPNAYPDIYSACGNTTGMHIQAANQAPVNHTFDYNAGLQDIDVWLQ